MPLSFLVKLVFLTIQKFQISLPFLENPTHNYLNGCKLLTIQTQKEIPLLSSQFPISTASHQHYHSHSVANEA